MAVEGESIVREGKERGVKGRVRREGGRRDLDERGKECEALKERL